MVQVADADGIIRPVKYAKFREDKKKPGYSAEFVHIDTDPKHFDDPEGIPLLEGKRMDVISLLTDQVAARPNQDWLGTRTKNEDGTYGGYTWQTYAQIWEKVQWLTRGINHLNLSPHQEDIVEPGMDWHFIGIWSKNRWEWNCTFLSSMLRRGTVVGFYDSMGFEAVDYCMGQTKMPTIFASHEYLAKLIQMKKEGFASGIKNVVLFDLDAQYEENKAKAAEYGMRVLSFDDVLEAGKHNSGIELHPERVDPDDIIMLNYTSGTTGTPKGVKVTGRGNLINAYMVKDQMQLTDIDVIISYLPSPHVFDQIMFLGSLSAGGKVGYFHGDTLKLTEDCQVLQPTIFPSVPRLYNKIYAKIRAGFDALTGCKRWLADSAVSSKSQHLAESCSYKHGCYDTLIFGKVAKLLGGRVRMMVTASAPISKEVLEFVKIAFSCPVVEAYGLSETQGAATVTHPHDPISGTIGGPGHTFTMRLKDLPELGYTLEDKPFPRGEICMKGPCIFKGYFNDPEKTAEMLDDEGFLLSGDVAELYPNGTLRIFDRSKNIFKLSQGEYLAPEKLENAYIQSPYIAQCMIYGDSLQSCAVAIVVADPEALKGWCSENGTTPEEAVATQNADFKKFVLEQINDLAKEKKFNSLEKPKDIFFTTDAFSVENDILTPTFKLKRNIGAKIYRQQIDDMYAHLKY